MAEEFKCKICMVDLVDSKALPCGHSLCKRCKLNLIQFNDDGSAILKCPNQCEKFAYIQSDQTMDDVLQENFLLANWLEILHNNINAQANRNKEENAHEISPSRHKDCFEEHTYERSNRIKISYDSHKKCFLPVCETHDLFANFVCKQCNNSYLCVYCKNRIHKDHETSELDSYIQKLKADINTELEAAKKLSERIIESEDYVLKELQNFREELTNTLLIRKYINLNKYFAQLNEEESNILKEFDEQVKEFHTQREQVVTTCNEIRKIYEDQEETANLLILSDQNLLMERLQAISNELLLKVVLHDRTADNHLGRFLVNVETKSTSDDGVVSCKIISDGLIEMFCDIPGTSDFPKFMDDIKLKMYSFEDIIAIIQNGKDLAKLRMALKFAQVQKKEGLLEAAVKSNQWEMVKVLIDCTNIDINAVFDHNTSLMIAAKNGYKECVNLFLEKNCDVDFKDNNGLTALMLASKHQHVECVKSLLRKHCDVNLKDKSGWTALMWCCRYGHIDCVKPLLKKNCNVDLKGNNGLIALMLASRYGHYECVDLLLEHTFDVNIKDNHGCTALMLASIHGHVGCVELLLKKNSDVYIKDNNGRTAVRLASFYGQNECVEILNRYKNSLKR